MFGGIDTSVLLEAHSRGEKCSDAAYDEPRADDQHNGQDRLLTVRFDPVPEGCGLSGRGFGEADRKSSNCDVA